MSEVFWAKLYCKISYLFHQFLLALRLWEIKKNFDDIHWNLWTNTNNLYARNNIFKKQKKSKCEILNHLYFCPNFVFWGTALGRFSQWFFNFSFSISHGGQHLHSPTIEKLPTTLSCDWILKEYAAKMIALVISPEKLDKFVN